MRYATFEHAIARTGCWLALGCLLAAAPAGAATPFSIHRTTTSDSVRGSVPVAVVSTAPFDDASGLLTDGLPHCYVATDGGGDPVRISVHKNPGMDTIRVSFDDEDPASAPVDAALSSVVASPPTIPADGTAEIVVTIVPRDSAGVPLGAGLEVSVDFGALWPGYLTGPVTDSGNGSYTARVTSTLPGTADVWVTVEGLDLDTEPVVDFEDTGALDLREQAIARLEDLSAPGGLFDQLLDGLDLKEDPGKKIDKAWSAVDKALDFLYSWKDKEAVSDKLKKAVGELSAALDDPEPADPNAIQALIDHILDAARRLALFNITEAEAECGACGQGGPDKICDAREALQEGDDELQSPDPDFEDVVSKYGDAVDKATDACG